MPGRSLVWSGPIPSLLCTTSLMTPKKQPRARKEPQRWVRAPSGSHGPVKRQLDCGGEATANGWSLFEVLVEDLVMFRLSLFADYQQQ
jgi:hypothetical protein